MKKSSKRPSRIGINLNACGRSFLMLALGASLLLPTGCRSPWADSSEILHLPGVDSPAWQDTGTKPEKKGGSFFKRSPKKDRVVAHEASEPPSPEMRSEDEPEKKGGGLFGWFKREPKNDVPPEGSPAAAAAAAKAAGEVEGVTPPPAELETGRVSYLLKSGDPLIILLDGPVAERKELVVDEKGYIKLIHLGEIKAVGKTGSELAKDIENAYIYRQIYKDIYVNVIIPSTYYYMGGEVRSPGRYPIVGRITITRAIPAAGNFTEFANPKKITILRNETTIKCNYREIQDDPSKDIEIKAGDVITVPRGGVFN